MKNEEVETCLVNTIYYFSKKKQTETFLLLKMLRWTNPAKQNFSFRASKNQTKKIQNSEILLIDGSKICLQPFSCQIVSTSGLENKK
jgi:hypothetical protein